jgi:hypothetical protein
MKTLATHSGDALHWLQPKALARRYELRSGDDVYAALEFRSSMGTLAVAESAEGTWTFKRVGFLHPRVTVRLDGSEQDVAAYRPRFFGGGSIEIGSGKTFQWRSANFWSTKWGITDAADAPVMEFSQGVRGKALSDLFKTQVTVEIHWHGTPGIPLVALAALGMYLLLLQEEEASTAATVSVTS